MASFAGKLCFSWTSRTCVGLWLLSGNYWCLRNPSRMFQTTYYRAAESVGSEQGNFVLVFRFHVCNNPPPLSQSFRLPSLTKKKKLLLHLHFNTKCWTLIQIYATIPIGVIERSSSISFNTAEQYMLPLSSKYNHSVLQKHFQITSHNKSLLSFKDGRHCRLVCYIPVVEVTRITQYVYMRS